ncbi:hypothetical protein F4808DRAFT_279562 [Astrocystis sublimbata]|nr:hypothetical protein F4808DRAFT_279562 [Astrocystis sublimbata]
MAQPDKHHGLSVEEAVVTSGEAKDSKKLTNIKVPKTQPGIQAYAPENSESPVIKQDEENVEVKPPEPKANCSKALPFNPKKVKLAAATKKSSSKTTAGVRKKQHSKLTKRSKKDDMPSLDDALSQTRKWLVAPTSYIIKNPDTGCFGVSARPTGCERPEITITHTEECGCMDVRLLHIVKHASALIRAHKLARRCRDSFVIVTKIRIKLPRPYPRGTRFSIPRVESIRRPRKEINAEKEIINVVDQYRQQNLVEKWMTLESYRKRRIWKDW